MSPFIETSAGWVAGMVCVAGTGAVAGGIGAVASILLPILGLA